MIWTYCFYVIKYQIAKDSFKTAVAKDKWGFSFTIKIYKWLVFIFINDFSILLTLRITEQNFFN